MEAHPLGVEFIQFLIKDAGKDLHQPAHFTFRPAPIFRREGIDGQNLDAKFNASIDDAAQVFCPCAVACLAG
jgi:hypothetical protein